MSAQQKNNLFFVKLCVSNHFQRARVFFNPMLLHTHTHELSCRLDTAFTPNTTHTHTSERLRKNFSRKKNVVAIKIQKNNCTYSRKHTKKHTHQPTTLYTVSDPNKERHTERLFNIKHSLYLIMLICSIRISSSKLTTFVPDMSSFS